LLFGVRAVRTAFCVAGDISDFLTAQTVGIITTFIRLKGDWPGGVFDLRGIHQFVSTSEKEGAIK